MNSMRKYIDLIEYAQNEQRVQWDDINGWNRDSNPMPEEYKNRLMNTFKDCHEMLDLISGGNAHNTVARVQTIQSNKIVFRAYGDAIENIDMIYDMKNNILYYGNIASEATDMKVALKILRGLIKFCQKLKIRKIKTTAGSDGAYQWARLGFIPTGPADYDSWEEYYDRLKNRVENMMYSKTITKQEQQKYSEIINKKTPEVIWELSDQPHGYNILKSMVWYGILDFTNPKCVERLRRFVRI